MGHEQTSRHVHVMSDISLNQTLIGAVRPLCANSRRLLAAKITPTHSRATPGLLRAEGQPWIVSALQVKRRLLAAAWEISEEIPELSARSGPSLKT